MKAFTVAAALDAGAITIRDTFKDNNNLVIGDVRIQNADRYTSPYGHGRITAGDVLKLSNNVGAAKIGLAPGPRSACTRRSAASASASRPGSRSRARRRASSGTRTGRTGRGDLTAAQNAFGQGLSVTAMQLVAGYAAIGNGGELVTPHVVAGWTGPDGVDHARRTRRRRSASCARRRPTPCSGC